MKKRILTGITTTGTPHIGNYLGAIKPALKQAKNYDESYYFLADYHAIIKNSDNKEVSESVKNVALAWLASGLDVDKSFFYRQSDIPEILELSWILNCVTAKGLMNRSHAYKAAINNNKEDEDKGITMGLFSYPILMAADILMFNATYVPVGADQIQHLEMTRDIAARFNHIYKKTFELPEAIIQSKKDTVPGTDGQKMSKSYGNIIPLLSTEKQLHKSIAKIVTNSLEPGEAKDPSNCTVFKLYKYFASDEMIAEFESDYKDGIGWGDAKNKLFSVVNNEMSPIRDKYDSLVNDKNLLNDLLNEGSNKVRPIAKEMLSSIRDSIGIKNILMNKSGSSWLKFGLFTVGLGQSFVFVIVPPLARELGLSEVQTSSIFAFSAIGWALTSATWGRASDRYGRRNIAILGLFGYSASLIAMITPLFLVEKDLLDLVYLFPLLVFGRMLNGLLGSATRPASFAYVADTSSEDKRTVKFARLESSFLIGTVAGPLIGGFLILISKETPFYIFSFLGVIASIGIYKNLDNKIPLKLNNKNQSIKVSWTSNTVWPFLFIASISSLCLASLIQTIGFYLFDTFSNIDDLPVVISITFALLSISTIVSQYIFTDTFPLSNNKLLIYGILLLSFSYSVMALYPKISIYYLSIIVNGLGGGLLRPAISSSLSLAQSPEYQGSVAGYLGSVYPIGHILTPVVAMPIYAYNPAYLYYFSSILCLICFIFIITNPIFRKN